MPQFLLTLLFILLTVPVLAQDEPDAAEEEDLPRVTPVFDPGSHTLPIAAMGFTKDKAKLITVGQDYTVQVWSTATGERLDILRLPGYGREKGYDLKVWDVAAVSPDGSLAMLGGAQKKLLDASQRPGLSKMVLVDVETREVHKIGFPQGMGNGAISALAFLPDGNRLAVAFGGRRQDLRILGGLKKSNRKVRQVRPRDFVSAELGHDQDVSVLAFSPNSQRLVAAGGAGAISLWKTPTEGNPELIRRVDVEGETTTVEWSPDGSHFLRAWVAFQDQPRGFELRTAAGDLVKKWLFADVRPFRPSTHPVTVRFIDKDNILMSTHGRIDGQSFGALAVKFNLSSGTGQSLLSEAASTNYLAQGAITGDHELAAISVAMGLDVVLYRVRTGAVVARCGSRSPIPSQVGWSVAGQPAGFAWSEQIRPQRGRTTPDDLGFGFNLEAVEPVANFQPSNYGVVRTQAGEWSIESVPAPDADIPLADFSVRKGDQETRLFKGGNNLASLTLIPHGEQPPSVAWATRTLLDYRTTLMHSSADGSGLMRLRPNLVAVQDLAPSPDGRYLIASTGTHRLLVYPTDGSKYPLVSFARVHGEWVAWTPEGYYAASPGGEKMFGWAIGNGQHELATFHPAEKFAAHFRRPDVIRLAIEHGSVERALEILKTKPADIETILPPQAELKILKRTGNTVQVKATATSGVKDKPVLALRVLLDGRALGQGRGALTVPTGQPAEAIWEFEIPPGSHQIKLQARGVDGTASSEPLIVTAPKSPDQQPVLHRLTVGVDDYDLAGLHLNAAAKDATDIHAALAKYCVGPHNRFGKAGGALLLNRDATRAAVKKALTDIRGKAKPGDLFVFSFAGHGVKQGDKYYLLTREANPSKSLEGISLSGEDLLLELKDFECPVLMILDACHSATAVKSFRPATDDLSRSLTHESAGVTVLAAAMSNEVASANQENGHFTAALLKALQAGEGVPYDPYDHALYTHHVYSVIFSEVRRATNGKQNPFLNSPWTDLPLALREVPQP